MSTTENTEITEFSVLSVVNKSRMKRPNCDGQHWWKPAEIIDKNHGSLL